MGGVLSAMKIVLGLWNSQRGFQNPQRSASHPWELLLYSMSVEMGVRNPGPSLVNGVACCERADETLTIWKVWVYWRFRPKFNSTLLRGKQPRLTKVLQKGKGLCPRNGEGGIGPSAVASSSLLEDHAVHPNNLWGLSLQRPNLAPVCKWNMSWFVLNLPFSKKEWEHLDL